MEPNSGWNGPCSEDFFNAPCESTGLLEVEGKMLPWTLSDAESSYQDEERSYTVSPFGHFIGYALDEIRITLANKPWRKSAAIAIVKVVGWLFRWLQIDSCLYFNNSLLSTNLWPNTIEWSKNKGQIVEDVNNQLHSIMAKKEENNNKKRAILWRSIDELSQPMLFKTLKDDATCLLIPARIANWCDLSEPSEKNRIYRRRDVRRDLALFQTRVGWDIQKQRYVQGSEENSKYQLMQIEPAKLTLEQAERMVDLHNQLYLDKYSRRNPQLTPKGLIRLCQNDFLRAQILAERKSGRMVGFSAVSNREGVMTASFVGYDVKHDVDKELYRLVMMMGHNALIMDDRVDKVHLSGGANRFKRLRGATSTVEYLGVFMDHLPWYRQIPWRVVHFMTKRIIRVENAR